MLKILVEGIPAPQGSKTAFIKRRAFGDFVVVTEASKKVKPWREAVALACIEATVDDHMTKCFDRELGFKVKIIFVLPAPKTSRRRMDVHVTRPDIDKLVRSTFDGITQSGRIWHDDSQVFSVEARKTYETENEGTGARIEIEVC